MKDGSFPIEQFRTTKTPFYYYDTALLRRTLDTIKTEATRCGGGNYHVHYAVKANANRKILRIISAAGLGADCGYEESDRHRCHIEARGICRAALPHWLANT